MPDIDIDFDKTDVKRFTAIRVKKYGEKRAPILLRLHMVPMAIRDGGRVQKHA